MCCSKCGSENPASKKFCEDCGAPLANPCPKCGAETTIGKRFCGECGAPLEAASAYAEPRESSLTGERRHLTVLFCDLVGSTEIAAQLDPEEWRELVASYHRAAAEAITRYGGHIAKYLGDGVMAYFGSPQAHEDDTERAARAGLVILEGVAKLNQQSKNPKLSVRVGIDSSGVVVGAGASKDTDVFGEAPNNAARVQALAAPGTVLITAATHRLVSGLFVVEDRGTQALKASERPLKVYRVIQPSGVRGRLEAAAATRGLTLFVGREEELRLLLNRWERVLDGEGQVALIMGEAGIGKSRILQHFHQQILATPHTWVEAAAAPSFQNTPFYPIAELLRQFSASPGDEPENNQLSELEPQLTAAGLNPDEAIPLIAPMLNLRIPPKYPPLAYSPEQRRRRLLAMMVEWVLGAARTQPLVIATEDVHWADASTLELIQLLVEQAAKGRALLLYIARPEFRPQWPLRAHHTQITLNRLSARTVRTLVEQVAARRALSDETVAGVVERTGGVLLFVEELTRALLESGHSELGVHEIPVTLHDSLMARLDRLGPTKEVAQVGAVIGGEFSYELIRAVYPIAENDLQEALRTLADADLLFVRGIAPEATYQFKHALIRDAAYEALLKSRRKELHRQVARAIEEKFAALKETHPEFLARHWTEADETKHAIAEWENAGKLAEGCNAFIEALENYRQALAVLNSQPESPERDILELPLRESVYWMLATTRGSNARETIDAGEHAISLARKTGNSAQLADLMAKRAYGVLNSGDITAATVLADQALALALSEGTNSEVVQAEARYRSDSAISVVTSPVLRSILHQGSSLLIAPWPRFPA
jgi:class 3 adenylate cyclase